MNTTPQRNVMGTFRYLDELLVALKKARDSGISVDTVFSPVPRHEIAEALKMRPSPVRFFTLTGGVLGILTAIALVVYSAAQWNFIVSGKPAIPAVPTVIVAFEFCILFSVLFTLGALLFKGRLPRVRPLPAYDERFSGELFGVLLAPSESQREPAVMLLRESGAEEVHDIES